MYVPSTCQPPFPADKAASGANTISPGGLGVRTPPSRPGPCSDPEVAQESLCLSDSLSMSTLGRRAPNAGQTRVARGGLPALAAEQGYGAASKPGLPDFAHLAFPGLGATRYTEFVWAEGPYGHPDDTAQVSQTQGFMQVRFTDGELRGGSRLKPHHLLPPRSPPELRWAPSPRCCY